MLQYYSERPYLFLIFAVLIALTVFVCIMAGRASSKRYKANEKIMKKLKEENELRNEFAVLTETLAEKSEPEKLFKGVALNLQKRVSDAEDMIAEFNSLTCEQREIYALSVAAEDGSEKLSDFFRASVQPLTGAALDAVKHIFGGKAAEIFESEFNSFDPDNETASVIPAEIEKKDAEFASILPENDLCRKAGMFIKENFDRFI